MSEHNAFFGELGPTGAGLEPFGTVSLHAVVDGYRVLLQPLPPAKHELIFDADTPAVP